MRSYLQVLIWLQLLSIAVSGFAAAVEIETIVVTGPIFSFVGLLIAVPCYRLRASCGFYFGLSVPTVSVLCFSIIFGLQWSPGEAAVPIACLLVAFAIVSLPFGVHALQEVRILEVTKRRRVTLQYGIVTSLGFIAVIGLALGLVRTGSTLAIAAAVLVLYTSVSCYTLRRFHCHGKNYGAESIAS